MAIKMVTLCFRNRRGGKNIARVVIYTSQKSSSKIDTENYPPFGNGTETIYSSHFL